MAINEILTEMAVKARNIDPLGKTLAFYLDDEILLIDGTADTNVVSIATGEVISPDCSVTMSLETFGKLGRKEIKPFMAVASGKIKVQGDLSIAAKLKKLT
ncbi:MAG: SCP2 sterol-binding domain-containing protein [Gammaproteobacteria bacterium]|nr:SCP2 sterol-binding domain-containing protein [Gammaproteobacteria bacterium]